MYDLFQLFATKRTPKMRGEGGGGGSGLCVHVRKDNLKDRSSINYIFYTTIGKILKTVPNGRYLLKSSNERNERTSVCFVLVFL